MPSASAHQTFRFGEFELDLEAGELRRAGRRLKLQPQPFKLLVLLTRRAGRLVSREEIRQELWAEGTFVDFDQAVNFAVKQIRDALQDAAERPMYIETVPRRGYRFIAPVDCGAPAAPVAPAAPAPTHGLTTRIRLDKALWTNIAEMRLAEARRRRYTRAAVVVGALIFAGLAFYLLVSR